jgi:hypothetical protein
VTGRPFDLRACLVELAGGEPTGRYASPVLTTRDMPAVAIAMVLDTQPSEPTNGDNDHG